MGEQKAVPLDARLDSESGSRLGTTRLRKHRLTVDPKLVRLLALDPIRHGPPNSFSMMFFPNTWIFGRKTPQGFGRPSFLKTMDSSTRAAREASRLSEAPGGRAPQELLGEMKQEEAETSGVPKFGL